MGLKLNYSLWFLCVSLTHHWWLLASHLLFLCLCIWIERRKESDKDLTHDIPCYLLFSSFFFSMWDPINIPLGMCANKNNYTLSQSHLLHQFMYIPTQLLFCDNVCLFLLILRCNPLLPVIKIRKQHSIKFVAFYISS